MHPDPIFLDFEAPRVNSPIRLVIVGDCVIPPSSPTLPLGDDVLERIRTADRAIANLEAPITDEPDPIDKSGPVKRAAGTAPELLVDAAFDAVTLANNHSMDYGNGGLRDTLAACENAGLATVGAGDSASAALEPLTTEIGTTTVTVLNVCEREFGIATDDTPGTAWIGHPSVESRIAAARDEADLVFVIAHGGIEYVPFPPPHVQRRFRSLIDSGADLIVGHHPHVAQGWERYHDGLILYSLGNFFFRQSRAETQWGLLLDLELQEDGTGSAVVVPVDARGERVVEMQEPERSAHVDHLSRLAEVTGDAQTLTAHWQAQATRVFDRRYTEWLTKGVGALPRQFVDNPRHVVDVPGRFNESADPFVLLNLIRNESHRAVIRTALEVRTGDVPDRRTAAVERTVNERLAWTDPPAEHEPGLFRRGLNRLLPDR